MNGYGQPAVGRGTFGRGRTGGRGRMRGGGGRGRRAARGRGGRMMMPGGGRGQQQKEIPCELDIFNRFIIFKICTNLSRDEQEKLGFAFPQFTPQPLTPEQQKMRMMQKMAEAKNPYGIETVTDEEPAEEGPKIEELTDENEEKTETPEETSNAEEKKEDAADEKEEEEEEDDDDEALPDPVVTEKQRKEMMKKREDMLRINMTDCHTLLAQLNTKRLYRRIQFFKKQNPDYNVNRAYPYGQDTEKISNTEWNALLEDYTKRFDEKERLEEEAYQRKLDAKRLKNRKKRQNKRKNKKGKSKDSNNDEDQAEENPDEVEDEVEVEEKPEDDSNGSDNPQEEKEDSLSEFDDETVDDMDFVYVADKPSKYELLMFTPCPRDVAVLASYPRSGNSLMRNLYEKITLRVTGSDMMGGLQKHDLVGEMATGTNNVQFVKTHYPERMGSPPFRVNRAVLLVRNPYDAMDSYFNLMSTSTHTTSLSPEMRKKMSKIFAEMAKKEVLVWRDFHEYWLKQKIPLLVVRYEDLIRDTVRVVKHVIKFVLEIKSMTFFEDRIHRAIGEEQVEKLGPYKARSGGIGKSLTKGNYTPELLSDINTGIQGTMEKFGYKEMLIPNPKNWRLTPLDQWGVFIPGTSKEPMILNQKGLVRGPNRQTNWRMVKQLVAKDKQAQEQKEAVKVDLN